MSFSTATTPARLPATNSASSPWYCQSTVPLSVTTPSSTQASTLVGTWESSMSACSTSPRRSASSWRCSPMSSTSISLSGHDPPDPLRRLLGLPLLAEAAHRSAQRHHAAVGAHRDRLGLDLRIPEQLVDDVGRQFLVVHGCPLDADRRPLR